MGSHSNLIKIKLGWAEQADSNKTLLLTFLTRRLDFPPVTPRSLLVPYTISIQDVFSSQHKNNKETQLLETLDSHPRTRSQWAHCSGANENSLVSVSLILETNSVLNFFLIFWMGHAFAQPKVHNTAWLILDKIFTVWGLVWRSLLSRQGKGNSWAMSWPRPLQKQACEGELHCLPGYSSVLLLVI